ncbi:hypothetical protein DL96DRAFT_1626133 [Flagelloscypha sp. PMI_526]|nr:hypothetical protein DL96DRAFT_1626133 [Flagelloscypha sp. PMI_526]
MASTLNMTLGFNFSSIFTLPKRLVSRMRRVDDEWLASLIVNNDTLEPPPPLPKSPEAPMLAGIGFFTSRYVIGLFLMAILLHRIQSLILPSGHRFSRPPLLNLASTWTRFILHIPTLSILFYTMGLWTITLLQTSYLLPSPVPEWATWATSTPFSTICWWTFVSICASFAIDSLIRVLSATAVPGNNPGLFMLENFMLQAGGGGALGGQGGGGGAPFNLVGYAFLLHVYSNPLTHLFVDPDDASPSRPDMHTVMTIGIPLIQLTLLHAMAIHKPLENYRLIPTAISSLLSLIHFHGTLWAWPEAWSPVRPPTPTSPRRLPPGIPQYPLLNYIPSILETTLILIIGLTLALNALAQIIVVRRVQNIAVGLDLARIESIYSEDFPVLLLRLGTASLESSATGRSSGWATEGPDVTTTTTTGPRTKEYGEVKMARDGRVMVITRGLDPGPYRDKPQLMRGWANEIRDVSLIDGAGRSGGWSWAKTLVGNWSLLKEVYLFATKGVWGFVKRIFSRGRPVETPGQGSFDMPKPPQHPEPVLPRDPADVNDGVDDDALYHRFQRGEAVTDDEDSDWVETYSVSDDDRDDESVDGEEENTLGLLADLRSPSPSSSRYTTPEPRSTAPILVAHMTSPRTLTRRRYKSLHSGTHSHAHSTATPPRATRPPPAPSQCVVCMSANREVICWPCRCLTVCDECRESMASGAASSSSGSRCPCCRRVVEGFSRIYVP